MRRVPPLLINDLTVLRSYRLYLSLVYPLHICLSVCLYVCWSVYLCVRSPISHYNFVKCGPIATKRDMEVAGYDTCIVEQYNGHRSEV